MEALWIMDKPSRIVHVQHQRNVGRGVFGAVGGIIELMRIEGFAIRALPFSDMNHCLWLGQAGTCGQS